MNNHQKSIFHQVGEKWIFGCSLQSCCFTSWG